MSEVNNSGSNEPEFSGKKQVQKKETIEEYRLVPADDYFFESDEQIDVIGNIKNLWLNRAIIFGFTAGMFLLGLIIFAGSERLYYSEISLVPERTNPQSNRLQQVQEFANIFGNQNLQEPTEISAAMYPGIVESLPFQIELMRQKIYFSDIGQEVTIYDYFTEHRKVSFIERTADFFWNITLGLPSTIAGLFSGPGGEREPIDFDTLDIFETPRVVDGSILRVSNTMKDWITITREPQTNLVMIGTSFPDANASAQISNAIRELLQEYVTEYRTDKALKDLRFIEDQYEMAKANFLEIQDSLAIFQDRNRNISTASVQVQEQRLQSEVNLAFELYEFFAKRQSDARIKVQEDTPVFRVQDPAIVPTRASHPRAARILVGSVFLGVFLGILFIYMRAGYLLFRREFANKDPKIL